MKRQVKLAKDVIAYTLYEDDVSEQVIQLITDAKRPAVGIGKAIIAVVAPIAEAIVKKQPDTDPAIWLSDGGVLDEIVDEIMSMAEAVGIELTDADAEEAKDVVFQDVQGMVAQMDEGMPPAEDPAMASEPAPLMQRAQAPMGGVV